MDRPLNFTSSGIGTSFRQRVAENVVSPASSEFAQWGGWIKLCLSNVSESGTARTKDTRTSGLARCVLPDRRQHIRAETVVGGFPRKGYGWGGSPLGLRFATVVCGQVSLVERFTRHFGVTKSWRFPGVTCLLRPSYLFRPQIRREKARLLLCIPQQCALLWCLSA